MRIPIVSRQNLHSCQLGACEVSWLPAAFFAACVAAVEWRWRPFGAPQPWDGDSFTPLPRQALFCSNSSDHKHVPSSSSDCILFSYLKDTVVSHFCAAATGISILEPLRASSAPTFSLHAHEELYQSLPI
ncbi:hypothetical protein QC763_0050520 [Podospora pseudopauciseta]|uniref:Uncharacterized protein n=1 Tax=Podospora pseudopauciseta TaxID=2093780 RepID=A0ABR0HFF6_9PEZI|nr:hypothetical protein QC763_0050520 [Podospora pseudopauciseta]